MAMNLFTSAKTVPSKQTRARVEKTQVEIEGLEDYAAIVAVEKVLKSLKEGARQRVDESIVDQFIIDGTRAKKRPENFKGFENSVVASCELRRRSTASALNDEEIALLEQYDVPTEESVTVEETYIINPAYASDEKMLARVSEALSKVKGLPSDFIMAQQGSKKVVVAEEAFDRVFNLPEKVVRVLMKVAFVVGIKPTKTPAIEDALDRVGQMFRSAENVEED